MPKFTVDVKAFVNVEVEAINEHAARAAADEWVEGMPTGISYVGPVKSATVSVDGESDVEEE
jgi:hypothetical protein